MVSEYHVMIFQECPRCKKHEPDRAFTSCSFGVIQKDDGTVLQEFECSRCKHKWEIKHK